MSTQLQASYNRRIESLQNECDALGKGVDKLSQDVAEAYALLAKYEPAYVAAKTGTALPVTESGEADHVPVPRSERRRRQKVATKIAENTAKSTPEEDT